jgi:hypothetical protein
VCIENLIRIDLVRESLNVDHNGRAESAASASARVADIVLTRHVNWLTC